MIALVQRASRAEVRVKGSKSESIGKGLVVLLGVHPTDGEEQLEWLARKCVNLRIFSDDDGKMNRSLLDVDGEALVVSQFTLYGNVDRGNRPSFVESAAPEIAEPMYDRFVARMSELLGKPVASGSFGAMMEVELVNDGPVTIWIERRAK
ncbi:MAG: D-tyrosyl-tRNA(Tyr) deacylase [Rhodothermia bacterium]|nr:D-tyrosyl-tRNA(Tyr) deacylase [Rhodothermia bacterium]